MEKDDARPALVLASNSPRRRQLIALGRWPFEAAAADVDETPLSGERPREYVLRLAQSKARASALHLGPDHLVVGADTAVIIDGDILGKPAGTDDAIRMLKVLRARTHQVFTGLAVLNTSDGRVADDVCITDVPMRDYSDEEIEAYVATGDPLDKAGAYAIQHAGFQPVAGMAGCFASVMGLPLCHLTRLLLKLDLPPAADVPAACQAFLQYECPVYRSILGA